MAPESDNIFWSKDKKLLTRGAVEQRMNVTAARYMMGL
jgi:hypothetical protein